MFNINIFMYMFDLQVKAANKVLKDTTGPTNYFTTDVCDPTLEFDFGEQKDFQMSKFN